MQSDNSPVFEFPIVKPILNHDDAPFWSVMIPVFDRVEYLERALKSVMDQAPSPNDMQITVINDGGAPKLIQKQVENLVRSVGAGRVDYYLCPQNFGYPTIFNICIRKSCGHWIHLLPDDDWVKPGYYQSLRDNIEKDDSLGAAFCRHLRVNDNGEEEWISWLEKETAGIIDDWLSRIATFCRLQMPSIVVKRSVYEELGGFCPQAKSAFDWEMWVRIAVHYDFWYEPQPLACFFQGRSSETYTLTQTGAQIQDALAAFLVFSSYFPDGEIENLSSKVKENYAKYALKNASEYMKIGNYQAANANIREALKCSQSKQLIRDLVILLSQVNDFP
jgi:glycosyltransferase involved in cell wall biosynthesis